MITHKNIIFFKTKFWFLKCFFLKNAVFSNLFAFLFLTIYWPFLLFLNENQFQNNMADFDPENSPWKSKFHAFKRIYIIHNMRLLEWILDSNDKTTNQFWLKYASIKDRWHQTKRILNSFYYRDFRSWTWAQKYREYSGRFS